MSLKNDVSTILGIDVDSVGWDDAFERAEKSGMSSVKLSDMIKAICKHLDPYIPDVIKKPESVNEQVRIFNPLTKDFSVSFDIGGNGVPMTFTARTQEINVFDPRVAIHMKKHLIREILQQRGITNPSDKDIINIETEISINPAL